MATKPGKIGVSNKNGADVDRLAKEIKEQLIFYTNAVRNIEPKPNFVIRKIHPHLKSIEKNVYCPNILSLGPYHHGKQAFHYLETDKYNCLGYMAMSYQEKAINFAYIHGKSLEYYVRAMECIEKKARDIYHEDIVMDGSFFSQVMFLDGCFILGQILLSEHNNSVNIPPYFVSWKNPYILRDMLLLENQIPFFAVEKVCELIVGEYTANSLRKRMVDLMEQMISPYIKYVPKADTKRMNFHHLLHLCHMYFQPIQNHDEMYHDEKEKGHQTRWRRAAIYDDVGIKIREKKLDTNNPHSLLDVTFCKNVMEIPHLHVDAHTATLLKNLVALEQTCPQYGNNVITYAIFLSQFMCMPEDVAFLVKKGIVSHSLQNDKTVADLFSTLSRNVMFDFNGKYYLKNMNRTLGWAYPKCLDRWVVRTGFNRFPGPWYCFFMVAGVIYVISACISTYFIALNYYKMHTYKL